MALKHKIFNLIHIKEMQIKISKISPFTHQFSKYQEVSEHNVLTIKDALAGVAQWIEHWPANQRVASSIPGQDICLAYGPGPQ